MHRFNRFIKRNFGTAIALLINITLAYICFQTWSIFEHNISNETIRILLLLTVILISILMGMRIWRYRTRFTPKAWIDDTFNYHLNENEAKRFVDRSALISLFNQQITNETPDYHVLGIHGIGGIGKSRLIKHYQFICYSNKVPFAIIHGSSTLGRITLLEEIYTQLHTTFQFSDFSGKLDKYREIQQKLREKIDTSTRDTPPLIRLLVASSSVAPAAQPIINTLGKENIEAVLSNIYHKLRKSDLDLLLDPEPTLTQSFVDDLNRDLTQKRRLVIVIDSFDEILSLEDWLRSQLVMKLSINTIIIIGSRKPLSLGWGNAGIRREILSPISENDSRVLLNNLGIKKDSIIDDITEFAEGLPLALTLAAELAARVRADRIQQLPKTKELVAPLIAELTKLAPQEITKPLEVAALVDWFDADLLSFTLEDLPLAKSIYQQISGLEFVNEDSRGRLALHPIVKKFIQEEMEKRSPRTISQFHTRIADWFGSRARKLKPFSQSWQVETLTSCKHRLYADEQKGLNDIYLLFDIAYQNYAFEYCNNIVEMLERFNLAEDGRIWYLILRIRLLEAHHNWTGMEQILNEIDSTGSSSFEIQAYVEVYRGRYLWRTQQWVLAEERLNKALIILNQINKPELMAIAFHALGDTYRAQGRYQEALDSCLKCVELWERLNEPFGLANGLINLGLTYRNIRLFSQAVTTLQRSTEIAKQMKATALQAKALYLQAGALLEQGALQSAKDILSASILLLEQQEQTEEILDDLAIALRETGMVLTLEGDYSKATEVINRSKEMAASANNHLSIILGDMNLSFLYLLKGELEVSKIVAEKAIIQAKTHEFPSIIAEACINLAFIAIQLGDQELSRKSIREALSIALISDKGLIDRIEAQLVRLSDLRDIKKQDVTQLMTDTSRWICEFYDTVLPNQKNRITMSDSSVNRDRILATLSQVAETQHLGSR